MKINEKVETANDMYKPGNVIVSRKKYYLVTSEYSLVDLENGEVCVTSEKDKESLISDSYDKNNDRLLKGTHLVTF